jgi:ferritin-like metal-binding protein YciE
MIQNIKEPARKKPTPATFDIADPGSPLASFFIESIKDIYWAEKELLKALPKMSAASSTAELAAAFEEHLADTRIHLQRLDEVFALMNRPPEAKVCYAMQGLVKEADSIIEETEEGSMTRDAAIIMAAQKVEHYEIATYGSLCEYAKTLGLKEIHGIFQATLEEERMADQTLTIIAQNKINWEAELEDGSDVNITESES